MKTKLIIASLISTLALIGAAQASPNSEPDNTPFEGVYAQNDNGATRAQVIADLAHARAAGLTTFGESDNTPYTALAGNSPSRAQVIAEIASAAPSFGDTNNVPFQG